MFWFKEIDEMLLMEKLMTLWRFQKVGMQPSGMKRNFIEVYCWLS